MAVWPRIFHTPPTNSASPVAVAVTVPFGVSKLVVAVNRSTPVEDAVSVPRVIVKVIDADVTGAEAPLEIAPTDGASVM